MGINTYANPFSMQAPFGQPAAQYGMNPMQTQPMMPTVAAQAASQAQLAQPQLMGRYVSSADEITPQEVSMSSSPSLFPLADGSAIIAKQWANDGTIKTVRYSADVPDDGAVDAAASVSLMDVMDALSDMQDAIDSLKKSVDKKPATAAKRAAAKKEATEDDSD